MKGKGDYMAHEVETMFYVSNEANGRFVPWHGLGTAVDEALTSKEAIELAGLNWKVESKRIFDEQGSEIPGFLANTRDTDGRVFGIVTGRYNIIQNEDAFSFTDNLIQEGVRYETAGSLRGGRSVWLLAKMPERKILGDKFEPYICFTNSHDGMGAIRVCMTPIRVVCNNTLNLALNNAHRTWSTRHIGDIQGKLQEARMTLLNAEDYMQELNLTAEKLAEKKISDSEMEAVFDSIYPVTAEDTARKRNNVWDLKENFFKCYNMQDIAQFKGTAWGVVNAATDMVAHSTPNRKTANYQENNWGKIMNGHTFVDEVFKRVA